MICQKLEHFSIRYELFKNPFYFPNFTGFTVGPAHRSAQAGAHAGTVAEQAGHRAGPNRVLGRAQYRGCRPQNRPKLGVRPGQWQRVPASWPAKAGRQAGRTATAGQRTTATAPGDRRRGEGEGRGRKLNRRRSSPPLARGVDGETGRTNSDAKVLGDGGRRRRENGRRRRLRPPLVDSRSAEVYRVEVGRRACSTELAEVGDDGDGRTSAEDERGVRRYPTEGDHDSLDTEPPRKIPAAEEGEGDAGRKLPAPMHQGWLVAAARRRRARARARPRRGTSRERGRGRGSR